MNTLHDANNVDVNAERETSETKGGDSHDGTRPMSMWAITTLIQTMLKGSDRFSE
jgi:hypothetical protein